MPWGPLGADPQTLVKRLEKEPDVTIRRALLLSLGYYGAKGFAADERKALIGKLQAIYRGDADPGLHAAAEWLLRTWQQEAWLRQVNAEWTKDKKQQTKRLAGIQQLLNKEKKKTPQWYVNGQGQTMVVIPGPVEFVMGSPLSEADWRANEDQHNRRIARTFALAATPVTKKQFLCFKPTFTHSESKRYPQPTCPIGGVDWFKAAAYCNWLSKQEGIPEDQWCYETNAEGQVTKLKEGYLSLTGYRLPTETEMEYATRAEALTARFYGETEELLPKYAWYNKSSQGKTWPVGSLKPNDLGLFDVQGNVYTWCQDSYKPLLKATDQDEEAHQDDGVVIKSTQKRVLRGGSFNHTAEAVRSAYRNSSEPGNKLHFYGFRPARTLPVLLSNN
ncbi:MAG: formylglycine-generating enzyme family protein [Gemmataceae bacterium]